MAGSLTLGDVTFSDFEIPENLSIGGRQQLVIHSLPGGRRVVDAMGGEDDPIRWSGIFSGSSVAERVRRLEQMRREGRRQRLAWNAWQLSVVIQQFGVQIASSTWATYRLQLCVLGSDQISAKDWLDDARSPDLDIGMLTLTALETSLSLASAALGSDSIAAAVAAAGQTAQFSTAQIYGLFSS